LTLLSSAAICSANSASIYSRLALIARLYAISVLPRRALYSLAYSFRWRLLLLAGCGGSFEHADHQS
jgi:hypothetical protein